MSLMIEYSDNFLKEAKQLSKKFKLLKSDLQKAIKEIEEKNDLGVALGFNLFKKRVKRFVFFVSFLKNNSGKVLANGFLTSVAFMIVYKSQILFFLIPSM